MEFFRKVKSYVLGEDLSGRSRANVTPPYNSQESYRVPGNEAQFTDRQAQTAAPKRAAVQPVLQSAGYGASGGVQGLNWYRRELKQDGDGDVAMEFFEESMPSGTVAETPTHALADAPRTPLKVPTADLKAACMGDVFVDRGEVLVVPPR